VGVLKDLRAIFPFAYYYRIFTNGEVSAAGGGMAYKAGFKESMK
jgi:hypothetical protein